METTNLVLGTLNLVTALFCGLLAVPLVRGSVPMNRLYGVRFRKSFESDDNWYRINRYGGIRMLFWSGVLGLLGIAIFFVPLTSDAAILVAACAPLIYLIPCVDSYRYSRSL